MAPFTVHTSSSLTRLAEECADRLAASPQHPLNRETVVLLSNGMGRWLSMQMAISRGVSAGMDFRFPNDTMDACFRAVLPEIPEQSPFALDTMSWRIAGLLPEYIGRPGFESITAYLGSSNDDRRLLQFARKLADTFDQYTIFRPRMVLDWDSGLDNHWQAELWRALASGCSGLHRAALLQRFRHALAAGSLAAHGLPDRINLFGISYLPPFHLDFFSILSRHVDVDFYLLNPCGAYWGDLFSERRQAELALNSGLLTEALEYYETGNPLLSSLGTQGQEFFSLLLDLNTDWNDLDITPAPVSVSLLGMIQKDILELNNRGVTSERGTVSKQDRSIQIHSCHGPLRELEILYDNLLQLFNEQPDLEPRDIVVMTPDIGAYAPYITATFGTRCGGRPAIPFTIADQSKRRESPVIDTFLRTLELPAGRFGINSILEVLECPQVMARFEISADELNRIKEWLQDSGVRWGLDGAHRSALGFPHYGEFSWRAGLDRLLLGYALAPDGDRLFAGVMPCDAIEGQQSLALGKLAAFIDTIEGLATLPATRRSLVSWADTLADLTARIFSPLDGNDTSCSALYDAFQVLRESQQRAGFDMPIGLEGVQETLVQLLEQSGESFGFLGGRVTFCAMLPMRSIPLKTVCLIGLNDAVFPRSQRLPAFSLMSGARKRGDRSLRDEDRYLFLEALLSAQNTFYISYTGQNDRDNTTLPPSVVVAELLDYVRHGFTLEGSADTLPEVITRHRLQPFSPVYFSGDPDARLFSYSPEYSDALEAKRSSGQPRREFIHTPLAEAAQAMNELDLQQMIRFLHNPARTFLAQSMGVTPYDPQDEIEEREPFTLESLAGYSLKQELTARLLTGSTGDDLYDVARARSILPPLASGRIAFEGAMAECREFSQLLAPYCSAGLPALPIAIDLQGTLLNGSLKDVQQECHLRWRCASLKGRDRLSLWCEHLILNTLQAAGYPRSSFLVCKDLTLSLPPIDNAHELLVDLLEVFRQGLRRPLPFFPQSSWLFLTEGSLRAEEHWQGTGYSLSAAESSDAAFSLCFGSQNPLDEEFITLAQRIYGPLLKVASEEKNR